MSDLVPSKTSTQSLYGCSVGVAGPAFRFLGGEDGAWSGRPGYRAAHDAILGSGASTRSNPYADIGAIASGSGIYGGLPVIPAGTYEVYRLMALHPTLVIARASLLCPILAAAWSVEADDKKAPGGAKELIERTFLPHRVSILSSLLIGVLYGWASMEQVWGLDGEGAAVPLWFKPLLHDLTNIRVHNDGRLAGVDNQSVPLDGRQCIVHTHEREGDNHYGKGRYENCRRTWANWLGVDDNLHRLGLKVASIIPHIGYPQGQRTDPKTGEVIPTSRDAATVARGMSEGRPVTYPNLANIHAEDLRKLPDLAKASAWNIGTIDMGNSGPAQSALLEQLAYYDRLFVRGMGRPERTLMEATGSSSRADAEAHGDLNDSDSDQLHAAVVKSANAQSVDAVLLQNYGPKAVGTVRIRASEIIDEHKLVDLKVLDKVLANGGTLAEFMRRLDVDAWADRIGVKTREGAKGEWKPQPDPAKPTATPGKPGESPDSRRTPSLKPQA